MAWLEKRNGKYRVCYRQGGRIKRIIAYSDKLASKAMMAELEKAMARGERGLVDPFKDQRDRPLCEHLSDWIAELRQSGRSNIYVGQCASRITRLATECGWKLLVDINPGSFLAWRETAT